MLKRKTELDEQVVKLESSIESLALEYRDLIVKVEKIKSDMSSVQIKVKRSVDLIRNLSSERVRWEESSQNFVNQMGCLLGDCLFASGFMTYIGFFDHFYRNYLQIEWKCEIDSVNLKRRDEMKNIEFLSTPGDRLQWQKEDLPADNLCIENAIIMNNYNRYPLVIDPSD